MTQRIGRDERLGFVRSAFAARASSIVAARWIAEDHTTVAILSRFWRYLRYLPRDRALQQAQLDVLHGRCPEIMTAEPSVPRPTHLAWWACWTLYGDAGYQTRAHPLVRWLRQLLSRRLTQ
jgi:CHAT domain-containing protein